MRNSSGFQPVGNMSNSRNSLMNMAGAGQYAASYGLIRRGDKARKAEEARVADEKKNSLSGTNELLEKQNRLLEQNLTVE